MTVFSMSTRPANLGGSTMPVPCVEPWGPLDPMSPCGRVPVTSVGAASVAGLMFIMLFAWRRSVVFMPSDFAKAGQASRG